MLAWSWSLSLSRTHCSSLVHCRPDQVLRVTSHASSSRGLPLAQCCSDRAVCSTMNAHAPDVDSASTQDAHSASAGHTAQVTNSHTAKAKRKVAIFIAYVGSNFRGLQIQRDQPGGTVEDVLQHAIHAAGAILPSNFGNLHKIGWTRSSRTDKGVHALANVVAMKLECKPESFTADPEGSQMANSINQHLPAEVRVLSVQRVNNGFNARGFCKERTYHYYLPTTILGLALDGGTEDAARMRLLRQCCDLYQGNHPFHNYTKRRLYRPSEKRLPAEAKNEGVSDRDQGAAYQHTVSAITEQVQQMNLPSSTAPDAAAAPSQQDDDLHDWQHVQPPGEDSEIDDATEPSTTVATPQETATSAPSTTWTLRRSLEYRWLDDMVPGDRLAPAHYRFIRSISVDDPMPLTPNGASAIRVSITGSSFMLHQIRHMMGAAAAVARGNLPLEFVAASLCAPARAVLPLAPPQVLVLADNSFQLFPSHCKDGTGPIQTLSGPQLQLKGQGQAARADFARTVLHPAIEEMFAHEVWAHWDDALKLTCWHEQEMQDFAAKAATWQQERAVIAAEKQTKLREEGRI